MTLSWSQKLFLKINGTLGRRAWLDRIMVFFATWGIVALFGIAVFDIVFFHASSLSWFMLAVPLVAAGSALCIHWVVAVIWRHKRPHAELSNVKTLCSTVQEFKSFPSDHAMIATVLAVSVFFFSDVVYGMGLAGLWALCVAAARVYVGLHYPRDFLGGILSGLFFFFLSYFWFAPFLFSFFRLV
ncbi:MAG TPA: hypothetical protein DCY48_03170 [Candidatus Magasanikbacteria bacterium]|nr:MAG: hypothetical protein A3I74_04385 [Candidatus Magasanikbacteria bacterium RIFCSPLOWO2_02_FULL_47_16]OGH79393.1 MAG: hypothetical protein A3C10_04920 [Candidatus Magasanikbacteria bacterium RIFCSPHIGHO2_02_FULL_48_18]OGH82489.1 MAG: hypothetical protein A3G08_00725 [Candidatus Magasanikbacteria bacterium RIFCSPLOWO2_12_FULL_47_9b]HAZ28746.1 hypothetical protein [Candidatus Magasanikbacteria bacterium]